MSDEKGFEINDRRKAGGEGADAGKKHDESGGRAGDEAAGLPPLDFISFCGSLGGTALMYLGERLSPDQPETPKDLPAAKHMIDLLDLLKQKTKGNLAEDEAAMLDNLLYNLRMRYIHAAGGK